MRRRDFIKVIVGSGAAWPRATRAQQAGGRRRVGVLMNIMSDDPESQIRLAAFAQGLQQLGWIVGQNVSIDTRWGVGNLENLRKYSAELVALGPDVIMANSSAAVSYILAATRAIPVVFTTVTDPVGAGYVKSLAHPGGNITGFTNFEYAIAGKWLELLKEIAPGSVASRSCGNLPWRLDQASLPQYRQQQRHLAWTYGRSTRVIPVRSNVPLWNLRTSQMAG